MPYFLDGEKMKEEYRYWFWKWLICKALRHTRIYWLLWGVLVVMAICAWRFGLAGLLM